MSNIRGYIATGFGILALLLALDSATDIMDGNLKQGLTPGWIDFAVTHPTLFGFILVGGAALFGGSFIALVENA